MYSMKHPASISRWFFASQWAVPRNYWNFCFALWRVSFHNCKRCAWDSPRDEPVKHFFVSRFSVVWTYQTLIFSLCKTNQSLPLNMHSFEDRKSLIRQLSAATCFVGVREQNFGSYTSAQIIQLESWEQLVRREKNQVRARRRILQSLPLPSHGFSGKET